MTVRRDTPADARRKAVMASSLPRTAQRASGFSAPFDPEEMSNSGCLDGKIHRVHQMVSASMPVNTETPEEIVKHDEEIATQVATEDST